jgi:hypothetical protein
MSAKLGVVTHPEDSILEQNLRQKTAKFHFIYVPSYTSEKSYAQQQQQPPNSKKS